MKNHNQIMRNSAYCLSLLMCLSTFVAEGVCYKKINASKACIKELRAGDVDIYGHLKVNDASTFAGVVTITDTTQSTNCANGALVVSGGVGIGKNLNVCGQVNYNIGATYTIGVDFPTIQSGIDFCSSGLKPDSASNVAPLPAGAKNVTLNIPKGIYNETLFIDIDFSDPTINDPVTGATLQGRGLRLIGDTRPIANMTYMNGGLVETDPSFLMNSGANSLGTLNSVVSLTLSNGGNSITVTNNPGPNPNFNACGIIPGDTIIVMDNTGIDYQRTVTSISSAGNTVNFSGGPVMISGNGATLTFCANVNVIGALPDAIVWLADGQVEMVGIWFSENPAITNGYDIFIEGTGKLFAQNILLDCRNSLYNFGFQLLTGGQLVGFTAEGDISGHISVIAGGITANNGNTSVVYGNWYVMTSPVPTADESCLTASCSSSLATLLSAQVNGAGVNNGFSAAAGSGSQIYVYGAFNCQAGVQCRPGGRVTFISALTIDNCTVGLQLQNGNASFFGLAYFGAIPTITNCGTAVFADVDGAFSISSIYYPSPLLISNCTNGFLLTNGSQFSTDNNVTFTAVKYPYAIDATSTYNTAQNVGTDPSPNNIYTYSTAGSPTMNSAYLRQLLDSSSPGVVNLQLNPGLTNAAGASEYLGKIYTLTATSAGPHTLTLLGVGGPTFLDGTTHKIFTGIGSTLTIQIDSATKVAILSNIGVV